MPMNESSRGSFRYTYDPNHGAKETPSEAFRPLIADTAARFTRYGPQRLEALLDHEGHPVPIEQIRGFLAGM